MAEYPRVEVDPVAVGSLAAHVGATTGVHGIADTSRLITQDNISQYASTVDTSALVQKAGDTMTGSLTTTGDLIARNGQASRVATGLSNSEASMLFGSAGQSKISRDNTSGLLKSNVGMVVPYFQSPDSTTVPVIARGMTSQTGNIQEWQDSTGVARASVDAFGALSALSVKVFSVRSSNNVTRMVVNNGGSAVGVQMNADAATTNPLVVQGAASQNADLLQGQNSAGAVTFRVWNDGGVGTPYLNGGSGGARLWLNGTAAGASVNINATADTQVPLYVRANSATQSGDLQQWVNATPTVVARVGTDGSITAMNTAASQISLGVVSARPALVFGPSNGTSLWQTIGGQLLLQGNGTAGRSALAIGQLAAQTADPFQVQDSTNAVLMKVSSDGFIHGQGARFGSPIPSYSGTQVGITAQAGASALALTSNGSSNIQEWRSSGGTVVTAVAAAGNMIYNPATNGDVMFASGGSAVTNSALRVLRYPSFADSADSAFFQFGGGTSGNSGMVSGMNGSRLARFALNAGNVIVSDASSHASVPVPQAGALFSAVAANAADIPIAARGAAGQSGDLQQWQDSTGVALSYVSSGGRYNGYIGAGLGNAPGQITVVPFITQGAFGQSADLLQARDSTTTVLAAISSNGSIWTRQRLSIGQSAPNTSYTASVIGINTTTPVLMARGAVANTVTDLVQIQDASPATVFAFTAQGRPKWTASALTQLTVGAAGGASALPATPTKYLQVVDDTGTTLVVPAYAAA